MTHPHRITTPDAVREFALAGNATLTLLSRATGTRFTYRIRQPKEDKPYFVGLLRGQDNENDFQFMGTIFKHVDMQPLYISGRNSKIGRESQSSKAFVWFWDHVRKGELPNSLEVWHEGRCGRCGRKLTVPSSIESGMGPECARITGYHEKTSSQTPLPGILQRQA